MRNNPACPIANIFVLMGDIGIWGQGQERKGRSKRTQGPAEGVEGKNR